MTGTRCRASVHTSLGGTGWSSLSLSVASNQCLQMEVRLAHAGGGCQRETFVAHMWFCESSGLARQSSGLKTGTTANATTASIAMAAAATWRTQQAAIGAPNCQSGSVDKGSVCRRKGVTCHRNTKYGHSMEGGTLMVCLLFRPLHQMPIWKLRSSAQPRGHWTGSAFRKRFSVGLTI